MLVKHLMSWPVHTVFDTSTVGEALEILRKKNIRHMPVVDLNQTLAGVVTQTDLVKVFPSGKELNTFQTNLLARTPVSKVMNDKPIFISPDVIIEEAALSMRVNGIGCLPVLDENKKLVGILTKNDIMDAFITSLGLGEGGTRITIVYKKKWGFLSELTSFIDKHNVYIDNIVTLGPEIILKVRGKASDFVNDLRQAGYVVSNVSFIEPTVKAKAQG